MNIMDIIYPAALMIGASIGSIIINKIATRIIKFIERKTGINKVVNHVDKKLGVE
jgi:hypothetical protein